MLIIIQLVSLFDLEEFEDGISFKKGEGKNYFWREIQNLLK